MLREGSVGGNVFLCERNERIGVLGNRIHDLRKGSVGIAAVVLSDGDGGVDVFEECERSLVDVEDMTGVPLRNGIVEKFGGGGGDQIPVELADEGLMSWESFTMGFLLGTHPRHIVQLQYLVLLGSFR